MNLFVNREAAVPLHDQLCAQIGQLVASGGMVAGERLPSVRGLASRLGIHPQTVHAAYRSLAERGLIVVKEGSGARVADVSPPTGSWREGLALRAMAAYVVAQARARGHDDAALRAAIEQALAPAHVARLVVVNPHDDLQAIYLRELARDIALPMTGMTPEEVEAAGQASFADACVLASANYATAIAPALPPETPPVVFRLAPADPLLARVRAVAPDRIVLVVSASPRFVFLTNQLVAGATEEGQVQGADLADEARWRSLARLADLAIVDSTAPEAIAAVMRTAPYVHRLLADDVLDVLAARLSPESFRPVP